MITKRGKGRGISIGGDLRTFVRKSSSYEAHMEKLFASGSTIRPPREFKPLLVLAHPRQAEMDSYAGMPSLVR